VVFSLGFYPFVRTRAPVVEYRRFSVRRRYDRAFQQIFDCKPFYYPGELPIPSQSLEQSQVGFVPPRTECKHKRSIQDVRSDSMEVFTDKREVQQSLCRGIFELELVSLIVNSVFKGSGIVTVLKIRSVISLGTRAKGLLEGGMVDSVPIFAFRSRMVVSWPWRCGVIDERESCRGCRKTEGAKGRIQTSSAFSAAGKASACIARKRSKLWHSIQGTSFGVDVRERLKETVMVCQA